MSKGIEVTKYTKFLSLLMHAKKSLPYGLCALVRFEPAVSWSKDQSCAQDQSCAL